MNDVLDPKRAMCLLQIIETGSVRGAAEVLNLDPSVVSRAVAKLEKETKLTLLERRGRGVVATDAGQLMALFARRQQDLHDAFLVEVNNLQSAQRGHIELVLGEGYIDLILESMLEEFLCEYPDISYNIHVAGTEAAVARIVEDRAHIGFIFQPPNDVRLRSHYSRLVPFRVHVRKDHPLTRLRGALTLSDLRPYAGATLEDDFGARKHLRAAELNEHIILPQMLVTNSFRVLLGFAGMGAGYILTPRSMVLKGTQTQYKDLVSLPLANIILNNSRTHVVSRAGRHLPSAANRFLKHAIKAFSQV
ncbi:LysR family transcriptional regulator [Alcaligenaceae bacterium]|nr:LysR family transcriptional regulator [Alcaligenaceae bacterium]